MGLFIALPGERITGFFMAAALLRRALTGSTRRERGQA
jgi:hypothetical protein